MEFWNGLDWKGPKSPSQSHEQGHLLLIQVAPRSILQGVPARDRGWKRNFRVSSNPNHPRIPWFYFLKQRKDVWYSSRTPWGKLEFPTHGFQAPHPTLSNTSSPPAALPATALFLPTFTLDFPYPTWHCSCGSCQIPDHLKNTARCSFARQGQRSALE